MRRLGIFVVYDPQDIIDRYVLYWVEELKKVSDRLIVIYNGSLPENERKKLRMSAPEVWERENKGFDAGAYKDVICRLSEEGKLEEYDELILCNDTCYGPFVPMKQIFAEMDARKADFWGITKHFQNPAVPEHLQSYFLVIRERMLKNKAFVDFWRNMGYPRDVDEAITAFELSFTRKFAREGFTYDSYVDSEEYRDEDIRFNYNLLNTRAYKLTKKLGCPIFKKKNMIINFANSYEKKQLLDYIRNSTAYDSSMIWENALRLYNMAELDAALYFHYVLDGESEEILPLRGRTAVVACLYCEDNLEECIAYLTKLSDIADIYIGVADEGLYQRLLRLGQPDWQIEEGLSENLFDFLFKVLGEKKISTYQYLAFVNDRKRYPERRCAPADDYLFASKWDTLFYSLPYIGKIMDLFDKHPELGLLVPVLEEGSLENMPPQSNWREAYPYVKEILACAGAAVPVSGRLKNACAQVFWVRTEALQAVWGRYGEIERYYRGSVAGHSGISLEEMVGYALPYIVQANGYVTAHLESVLQASMLYEKTRRNAECVRENDFLVRKLIRFCRENEKTYIYGAGKIGEMMCELLERHHLQFEAFVVSDDQREREKKWGYPVITLSQSDYHAASTGYIIALGEKNTKEVLPILRDKGITNVYCL